MKTIGLLGGLSWESTSLYYRILNETIRKRRGKLHSAKLVLYSFDFEDIQQLQHLGSWEILAGLMTRACVKLQKAGAKMILICSNTMHCVTEAIEKEIKVPLLHIVDTVADKVVAKGVNKVGLLGTRFTMEGEYYPYRLQRKYGVETVLPEEHEREKIHHIIYKELRRGEVREVSKQLLSSTMGNLQKKGAQGILLACNDLSLLLQPTTCSVPLFDTSAIHAESAIDFAIGVEKKLAPVVKVFK